ncbi:hypothetical protein NG726_08735 [Pseudomonas sp. MOB-449]|nr:hypothetical protein [Pseudomonas sp. MOB-449]
MVLSLYCHCFKNCRASLTPILEDINAVIAAVRITSCKYNDHETQDFSSGAPIKTWRRTDQFENAIDNSFICTHLLMTPPPPAFSARARTATPIKARLKFSSPDEAFIC